MKEFEVILTWALIHSLWIAVGIWGIIKVLSTFIQESKKLRVLKIIGILTFIILTLTALFIQPSTPPPTSEGIWFLDSQAVYMKTPLDLLDQCQIWIREYSLLINFLWILGIVIGSIRFILNFRSLTRCKSTAIDVIDNTFISRVESIAEALSIARPIQVKVSALINSPMTIGTLKPIIYFPTGLISGFSFEEVDTLVRHELTHIKHNDYLVNNFLVIVETLFFFNPFAIIMIRDLRREMEYACDDQVIQVHDELAYSRALTKLQEITISNQVALAAKSNNSEFKTRIERMIYPNKTKFNPKAGIMVILLAVILVSSAFVGKSDPEPISIEVINQDVKKDTVRFKSSDEVKSYLKGKDSTYLKNKVILLNEKPLTIIYAKRKSEKMMDEIQSELIKDGILNENRTKITLMFQYSDVLQGERTLGKYYEKYKAILNKHFPVYDSFATTRIFRYKSDNK